MKLWPTAGIVPRYSLFFFYLYRNDKTFSFIILFSVITYKIINFTRYNAATYFCESIINNYYSFCVLLEFKRNSTKWLPWGKCGDPFTWLYATSSRDLFARLLFVSERAVMLFSINTNENTFELMNKTIYYNYVQRWSYTIDFLTIVNGLRPITSNLKALHQRRIYYMYNNTSTVYSIKNSFN